MATNDEISAYLYDYRTGEVIREETIIGKPSITWDYEGENSADITVKAPDIASFEEDYEPYKHGILIHAKSLLGWGVTLHAGPISKTQINVEKETITLGIGSTLDYLKNVFIYPYEPVTDTDSALVISKGTTDISAAWQILSYPWTGGAPSNPSDPSAPASIEMEQWATTGSHSSLSEDFPIYFSDGYSVYDAYEELKSISHGLEIRESNSFSGLSLLGIRPGFTKITTTLDIYNRLGEGVETMLPSYNLTMDKILSYDIAEEPYTTSRVIAVSRDSDEEENISSDLQHRVKASSALLFDVYESLSHEATQAEMNAVLDSRLNREKYHSSIYEISIHEDAEGMTFFDSYRGAILSGSLPRLGAKSRIIGITHIAGTNKYDLEITTDWTVLSYPQPTRKKKKEDAYKREKERKYKNDRPRRGNGTYPDSRFPPGGGGFPKPDLPDFPDFPDPDPDPQPDPGGGGGGGKLPNPDGTPALPDANDEYDDMFQHDPTMKWGITDAKTWTLPLSTGGEGWHTCKEEGVNSFYILSGSESRQYVHTYENNGTKRILPSDWNNRTWNISKMIFDEETGTAMSHTIMGNFSIPHTLIEELFVQGEDYDFHPLRSISSITFRVGRPFATGGYLYLIVGVSMSMSLGASWGTNTKSVMSIKHVRFPLDGSNTIPPVPEPVDLGIFGAYDPELSNSRRAPDKGALVENTEFLTYTGGQAFYNMTKKTYGGYHFIPRHETATSGGSGAWQNHEVTGYMYPIRPGNRSYSPISFPDFGSVNTRNSFNFRNFFTIGLNSRGQKSFMGIERNTKDTNKVSVLSSKAGENAPTQEGDWVLDSVFRGDSATYAGALNTFKGNVIASRSGGFWMLSTEKPFKITVSSSASRTIGNNTTFLWETDKWIVGQNTRAGFQSAKIERYEVGGLYPNDGGFSQDDLFAYYESGIITTKTPQAIPGLLADRHVVRMYQNDENGEMSDWLSTGTWEPRQAYEVDLLRNGFEEGKETFIEWETYASNDKYNQDADGEPAPAYSVSVSITPEEGGSGGTSGTPVIIDNYKDGDGWT